MDYDASAISTVYDEARGLAPERLQQWIDLVARDAAPRKGSLIVDFGCGTGRFSEPLAERFCARTQVTPKHCERLLQLLSDGGQRQSIWAGLERLLGQVDHHCHGGLRS